MSLPDSDYTFDPFNLWWVHDNCEPNYLKHDIIAEYWNVMSSLVFFIPYFIRIILFRSREVHQNILACYKVLIAVGVGSIIYHSALNFFTQALDMSLIIIAESIYLKALGVELSAKEDYMMSILYAFTLFHPVFPALICAYLFIIIAITIVRIMISIKGRPAFKLVGVFILIMNLGAVIMIPLDMLCTGFLYYHAIWHVAIMIYCFSGSLVLEVLYDIKKNKGE